MTKIPTFKEVWMKYLFDDKAHTGSALLNEDLIRDNTLKVNKKGEFYETDKKSTTFIEVPATDFMADGKPGRFVNGACFKVIRNFFPETQTFIVNGQTVTKQSGLTDEHLRNHNLGTEQADGSKTFTLKEILTINEMFLGYSNPTSPNSKASISQRQFSPKNETAYDFAKRVQLFETTSFQLGAAEGKGNYDVC